MLPSCLLLGSLFNTRARLVRANVVGVHKLVPPGVMPTPKGVDLLTEILPGVRMTKDQFEAARRGFRGGNVSKPVPCVISIPPHEAPVTMPVGYRSLMQYCEMIATT